MARPNADRVKAIWTGTGTGTITLGGAAPGEAVQAFPASLNGQTVPYLIIHETANEAEVGHGVYTHAGTTLSRLYRYYPTLGGAAVNFSNGTKFVTPTVISAYIAPNIATTNPTVNDDITAGFLQGQFWINTNTPAVFVCRSHATGAANWAQIDTGAGNIGTSGSPLAGQYARFTGPTSVEGRTFSNVVADIQSLLPSAVADYRGLGSEAMSEAFDFKVNSADLPVVGNLAGQDEADLPSMSANFRGAGSETMTAAFAAVSGGAAGLTSVADSGTTVTVGSSTNGTFRRLTADTTITVVLAAAAPAATRVRLYRAGTGLMNVTCQAAQAAGSGAGYYVTEDQGAKATAAFTVSGWIEFLCQANTGGDSAEFIIVDGAGIGLPSTVTGSVDFTAAGIKVPNGSAVSGTLTVGAHGGGVYKTSGNCTITPSAGFTVTLLLGGAHTIGAGGTAHSPASGDAVSVVCFSATNGDVKLFKTVAASVINLPTA